MAQLGKAFDSSQHDDMGDFDPIPAGQYPMIIDESSVEDTAKKTGKYIKFRFKVINGEFKGRFVWTNLNIINPNPVAVEIAQKELATICRACGKAVIQDTQELHGIPMLVKVRIIPPKGDYPAKNAPSGYKPISEADGEEANWDEAQDGKFDQGQSTDPVNDDDVPWGDEE